jgi:hypothetical protein
MMRLFVSLGRDEMDALVALAQRERRRPQDQAGMLLRHALGLGSPTPLLKRVPQSPTGQRGGDGDGQQGN